MQRRATLTFGTLLLGLMLVLSGCGIDYAAGHSQSPSAIPKETVASAGGHPDVHHASDQTEQQSNRASNDAGAIDGEEIDTEAASSSGDKSGTDEQAKLGPANRTKQKTGGTLQVHFIDVGQGASQLIIGPTGKTMLIDGGDNHMEEAIVAYLQDQGIRKIDILIGTHPHADHIGGLDAVVDHFDIGKIYMPRVQANTKTFESLLRSIQKKGLKVTTAKAGLTLDWEPDVEVNMVAPVGTYDNVNDMSAVVHLAYGDTAFLFTGDAEAGSEADILRSGADIKADVLLVGHHGSATSTGDAFLDKVDPDYGVIQVGDNQYGHPHEEVLNRLAEHGVRIYRSDVHGTVVFESDGETISVAQRPGTHEPAKPSPPAGGTKPEPERAAPAEPAASAEPAGELAVTAAVDNETPAQNSKVTVTVKVTDEQGNPVSGAEVHVLLHYKSTKTAYEGTTDAAGTADIAFRIGRAAKGYAVKGEITVTAGDRKAHANVSFTPR